MRVKSPSMGDVNLSGNMIKQSATVASLDDEHTHISCMGKMLEDSELSIRNSIEGIYIQKTREILNGMRSPNGDMVTRS